MEAEARVVCPSISLPRVLLGLAQEEVHGCPDHLLKEMTGYPFPHIWSFLKHSQAPVMLLVPWKLVSFSQGRWGREPRRIESIFGGQPWGCLEQGAEGHQQYSPILGQRHKLPSCPAQ